MDKNLIAILTVVTLLALGGGVFVAYLQAEKKSAVQGEREAAAPLVVTEDPKPTEPTTPTSEPAEAEPQQAAEPTKPATTPTPATKPVAPAPKVEESDFAIIEMRVSFGFEKGPRDRAIDTVVLHSSYNSTGGDVYDLEKVIAIWKSYGVAPHYTIDRKGKVYRLVADSDIAYHAGTSKMPDGRTNVNDFSIGVEILNTLDDKYTDAQYEAVNDLIAYLKSEHKIEDIVGHDTIAPGRKSDPWNFDWKRMK